MFITSDNANKTVEAFSDADEEIFLKIYSEYWYRFAEVSLYMLKPKTKVVDQMLRPTRR